MSNWVECQDCGQMSCLLEDGVACLRLCAPGLVCHGIMQTVTDKSLVQRNIKKALTHLENAHNILNPYPYQPIDERIFWLELDEVINRLKALTS